MTDNDVFDTRDKLVNTLEKQKQDLKARFCELMETNTNRLPLEPYEKWPKEARTADPVFQSLIWILYCGEWGISLEVMTYRQG